MKIKHMKLYQKITLTFIQTLWRNSKYARHHYTFSKKKVYKSNLSVPGYHNLLLDISFVFPSVKLYIYIPCETFNLINISQ